LGGIIIIASLVGILGAFFRHRLIVYLYLLIVIIALIFQVYIGVKVYQKASNAAQYLAPIWTAATSSFRANLQNEVIKTSIL
jgi:hypothetical protein